MTNKSTLEQEAAEMGFIVNGNSLQPIPVNVDTEERDTDLINLFPTEVQGSYLKLWSDSKSKDSSSKTLNIEETKKKIVAQYGPELSDAY